MATILDNIVEKKRQELAERRAGCPLDRLQELLSEAATVRGFARCLAETARSHPALIAEVKRGSPSLGYVRPDLDPAVQVKQYAAGGAACLSVLTDESFFFGSDDDFRNARRSVTLPMLRKDFMIDPYQIYESRSLGADCVLLIMAILDNGLAHELAACAHELGMDVLAEVHDAEEIRRVVDHVEYDLLGINNRNLKTFETSEQLTIELAALVPDPDRLVAESGLHDPGAIRRLWQQGIRRFLVGTAFVQTDDPEAVVRSFATIV